METYDVAVIGMGPGGEYAAGKLAAAGLSVLGVDDGLVGGTCPYWGCIPTKMMVHAARRLAEARRVPGTAGAVGEVRPDWSLVATRIREEATDDWDDTVAVKRFTDKGGTFVRGTGRVVGPRRLEVDGTPYAVRRSIVVATGSTPAVPRIDGLADVRYWTNRDLVRARELPASVIVLGGGAIGCELTQVLARFGVDVTIVDEGETLLAGEEPEAGRRLRQVLEDEGVRVVTRSAVARVAADGDGVAVTCGDAVLRAERLLVATGRSVDLRAVGLDALGVDPTAPSVDVDERCRVVDGDAGTVHAVGDITGEGAFTHVAMYQAEIVVRDLLDRPGPPADYRALPRVTFTDPEVAAVGLTQARARERLDRVAVASGDLGRSSRGWIDEVGESGLVTLVVDADRDVLVGATVVAPAGGEVLGLLALAVHAEVPIARLRSMIYAYPTLHRGVGDALRRLH